jgi:hypothetical protein
VFWVLGIGVRIRRGGRMPDVKLHAASILSKTRTKVKNKTGTFGRERAGLSAGRQIDGQTRLRGRRVDRGGVFSARVGGLTPSCRGICVP